MIISVHGTGLPLPRFTDVHAPSQEYELYHIFMC